MTDNDNVWEPAPVPETRFWDENGRANINRAPVERVSGVVYKRSVSIKRVLSRPADPAPDMPEPWQGHGDAVVRWLFSEQPGTDEGLLRGRSFAFLQELTLAPESATGHRDHCDRDTVLYVVAGGGSLHHRPTRGSPAVARPLRVGDAVLISSGELYSVCNESESESLRLIVLGLSGEEIVGFGGVNG